MGKPERPSTEYLLSFFPGIPITVDQFIAERRALQDIAWPTAKPLPGVVRLVTHLVRHNIPIAIATGSLRRNYDRKTGHLQGLFGLFRGNVACGDDEELRGKGKPMPDVFLVAAKKIERDVGEGDVSDLDEAYDMQRQERARGLVFEDATSGVIAAVRAGMNVVWVPDPRLKEISNSDLGAAQTLQSLEDFKPEEWGLPPYDN